jgi:nitroreductase
MSFLSNLTWRNAEKNFDPSKKVADQDLAKILESIRLAPTSYGLQPFHTYIVSNPELKSKLRKAGYSQTQFEEASHILIFTSKNDALHRVDEYIELASGGNPEVKEKLQDYKNMMVGALSNLTAEQAHNWAKKQAYIALGFALAACAELEIDSCPIEGFVNAEVNKILNLPENEDSAVILAIGYKKDLPHRPKVRFPETELFTQL